MTLFKLTYMSHSMSNFLFRAITFVEKYRLWLPNTKTLRQVHWFYIFTKYQYIFVHINFYALLFCNIQTNSSNFIKVDVSKLELSWFFAVIYYYNIVSLASFFVTPFARFIIHTNYFRLFKSFKSTHCINGECTVSSCNITSSLFVWTLCKGIKWKNVKYRDFRYIW